MVATYAHLIDIALLREHIQSYSGNHAELAFRARISPARLSQMLAGTTTGTRIECAAALEDGLGVHRGTLFHLDLPADLVSEYLAADAAG